MTKEEIEALVKELKETKEVLQKTEKELNAANELLAEQGKQIDSKNDQLLAEKPIYKGEEASYLVTVPKVKVLGKVYTAQEIAKGEKGYNPAEKEEVVVAEYLLAKKSPVLVEQKPE